MSQKSSKVFKSFSTFFIILNLFGILRLRSYKNIKHEIIARFLTFSIAQLFFCILYRNHLINMSNGRDSIIKIAQIIDRSVMILVTAALYFEATVRQKNNFQIFKGFQQIDYILLREFGLSFNYKFIKLSNNILIAYMILPAVVVSRLLVLFYISFLDGLIFSFFILGILVVSIMKAFYVSIVIQFLIRFKSIETIIDKESEKFVVKHKFVIEELFIKFHRVVDDFNESFGFTVLVLIGNYSVVIRSNMIQKFFSLQLTLSCE